MGLATTQRARVQGAAAALVAAVVQVSPATAAADAPRCFGRPATITGTRGDDRILGTRGTDVIAALGGDDVVLGDDSGDRICGGAGDDLLDGRYGNDLAEGGRGNDRLLGGPGDDLLVGGAGDDHADGGDAREDSDTVVGGAGRDALFGGDGSRDADYLFGGLGLDFMDGGIGGSDRLYGGPGNDRMSDGLVSYEFSGSGIEVDLGPDRAGPTATGEGADYLGHVLDVVGSPFADVIRGSAASNDLRGGGGDDSVSGREGFDRIDGGEGDDALDGGADADVVVFEDSPVGVSASFVTGVAEGPGRDSMAGFDRLEGSYYDDSLTGDDDRNWIFGSYGTNEIFGLGGNDYLEFGDAGDAGDGADECIWSELENCEMSGHFDPPSLPYLTTPEQSRPVETLGRVAGNVAGGLGGPHDPSIVVSIRRMTAAGCWWWDRRDGRFVRGGCGVTLENLVADAAGRWSLPVDETLPPGAYRVSVTWRDEDFQWAECVGAFAPMCVWFEVP